MFRRHWYGHFFVLFQIIAGLGRAQTVSVRPRVTEPVDESRLTTLQGNTHPMALPQYDRGPAPGALPMERMQLVLTRSPEQQMALHALLDAQQDSSSASFHKWLTPEQFGQQFGPADQDVQVVSTWLQSHGFQVHHIARGRTVIEFSGTADLVRNAFHTEIHKFVVNGEEHWANATDPRIPEALAPVVAGVATLHNFKSKPLYRFSDKWPTVARKGGRYYPEYNGDFGRALAPADYATIYNIKPVYKTGIDGTGVTIGIVGAAPILMQDIADFRKVFDLPKNAPQVVVNGSAPDYFQFELDQSGPDVEGTLDISWAGAIAPNATLKFILAPDTDTTDGISLSEEYAVDNNDVDILTESFYVCESDATSTFVRLISALREQAAAQGITWMVGSGDAGPYVCFNNVDIPPSPVYTGGQFPSPGPLTVNIRAASPYVVAVGGTEFTNGSIIGTTYFSSSNNPKTLGSAISYPPEEVWNDSCDAAKCGANNVQAASSSGGASKVFTKPAWQSGVAGIPSDGARDIPDISLTASAQNAPYLICLGGTCEGEISTSSFTPIGGTSAGTPAFAGIMALVDQKMKSRQGAVNYILYRLAALQQYSKCNGSSTTKAPDSACIFYDITSGNSSVPGEPSYGKPNAKYPAGVAFDLATGLGSLNVANLVNKWSSVSFHATNTTLAINPGTITHGAQANVQASVTPQSGSGTPTGSVSVEVASGEGYGDFPLTNGSVTSTVAALPGGTYMLHGHYSGDSVYAPSDSAVVPVTVTPEVSTISTGALYLPDIPYAFYTGGPYGNVSLALSARVAGVSGQGAATGLVSFTDNGNPIKGGAGLLNTESQAMTSNTNIVFPVGQHSVVASYPGDASFQASVSPPLNITITPAQTTTTVQPSVGQAEAGKQVTLMAIVEAGNAQLAGQFGALETGTVNFFLNGKALGTRSVSANTDVNTGIQNVIAVLHTSTLPQGNNTITATYSGDSNYTASSSQPVVVAIKSQPAACLVTNFTADPNPITLYDPPNATTISVAAKCQFDVRIGSPSGTLVGSGNGTFSGPAQLSSTKTLYLQQSGNTTSQGTLQKLAVTVQTGTLPCMVLTFGATPSTIVASTLTGSTTITAVATCNFDVRANAPNGPRITTGQFNSFYFLYQAVQSTGDTVTNGMKFFLQPQGDTKAQDTLATLTVPVVAPAPAP